MKPILYDFGETSFASNGLGRLDDTIECLVTEERNGIYECDFVVPVTGRRFDDILPGRSIAVTHGDGGDTQPFDIVSMSRPIDGKVTFHAVHVSYRLTGIVAKAKNINNLDAALQALVETAQPSDAMVFNFRTDMQRSGYCAAFDGIPRTVRQLLGGVEGSILDTYGGEYEFDRFNVVLHSARGQKRDFTVRYGVNLTEFQDDTDYQGTYTSCVPYWSGGDGGVIVTCNPLKVDSGFVSYDGRDTCIPLDLTDKFESKPTRAQLRQAALSVMQSKQTNLPSQNISVDFLRLQDFEEFKDFAGLLECNLCDSIDVVFPRYGMRGTFKIVRTVWDVLEGRYKEMELGNLQTSLAEALGISDGTQGRVVDGRVYVNGDDEVEVLGDLAVTGNLTANGSGTFGGALYVNGKVYFPNGSAIYYKDSGGNNRYVFGVNSNNLLRIGYELYSNSEGTTTLYGNNLGLTSRNPITISQPIASFFKITQEAISSGTISAGSYATGTSHTITAQSGYHAVGIVGWATTNYRVRPTTNYIASDTSLYCGFSNLSSSSASATITFRVLWLKATSA